MEKCTNHTRINLINNYRIITIKTIIHEKVKDKMQKKQFNNINYVQSLKENE